MLSPLYLFGQIDYPLVELISRGSICYGVLLLSPGDLFGPIDYPLDYVNFVTLVYFITCHAMFFVDPEDLVV